jgi:hypothetical protein
MKVELMRQKPETKRISPNNIFWERLIALDNYDWQLEMKPGMRNPEIGTLNTER